MFLWVECAMSDLYAIYSWNKYVKWNTKLRWHTSLFCLSYFLDLCGPIEKEKKKYISLSLYTYAHSQLLYFCNWKCFRCFNLFSQVQFHTSCSYWGHSIPMSVNRLCGLLAISLVILLFSLLNVIFCWFQLLLFTPTDMTLSV